MELARLLTLTTHANVMFFEYVITTKKDEKRHGLKLSDWQMRDDESKHAIHQ